MSIALSGQNIDKNERPGSISIHTSHGGLITAG